MLPKINLIFSFFFFFVCFLLLLNRFFGLPDMSFSGGANGNFEVEGSDSSIKASSG